MTKTFVTSRRKIRPSRTATPSASFPPSPAEAIVEPTEADHVFFQRRRKLMATITGTPSAASAGRKLSKDEIQRYSRHLIMPEVGMDGQLKLAQAKVLMIGAGGLGAPLGLYLAAAGVGRLGIVDFDVVDFTNLQRQITFSTSDVGRPKIQAAKERLAGLNPQIQID